MDLDLTTEDGGDNGKQDRVGLVCSAFAFVVGFGMGVQSYLSARAVTNHEYVSRMHEGAQKSLSSAVVRNNLIAQIRERVYGISGEHRALTITLPETTVTLTGLFLKKNGREDFCLIRRNPDGSSQCFVRLAHEGIGEIMDTTKEGRAQLVRQGALLRRRNNEQIISFKYYHVVFLGEGNDEPPCLIIDTLRNQSWTGNGDQVSHMSGDQVVQDLENLINPTAAITPTPGLTKK